MAKKSRKKRQRRPNVPVYSVPVEETEEERAAQPAPATAQVGSAPKTAPIAASNATTDQIDWASEYPYFAPDMKRLGIVVLLMVLLLLALNFVFIYVL